MFSTEQPDYKFNWEDMNRKVLRFGLGKDSYDGNEETTVVMGWERKTDTYYVLHKETKRVSK